MLSGKKAKRVMLNITEEMWKQITAISDLNGLPIEHVVRFLIAGALLQSRMNEGNAPLLQLMQQKATQQVLPTFAEGMAKPRKATNRNNHQQKEGVA